MAFDSVFNGDPRTAGVSASGKATNGIDISSGQIYYKDDAVGGWQPVAGGGGGGSGSVLTASVTLTPAQVKALTGSPVLLLAGTPGHIHVLIDAIFQYNFVTTPYTNPGMALSVQHGPASGNPSGQQITQPAANLLVASHDTWTPVFYSYNLGTSQNPVYPTVTGGEGAGVYITTDGSDVTNGDGTLTITLHYYDYTVV